jgi:hypothetical protein
MSKVVEKKKSCNNSVKKLVCFNQIFLINVTLNGDLTVLFYIFNNSFCQIWDFKWNPDTVPTELLKAVFGIPEGFSPEMVCLLYI